MVKKIGWLLIIFVLAACSGSTTHPATMIPTATAVQAPPSSPKATSTSPATATPVSPRVNFTTSGTITQDETWHSEIHLTGDILFKNKARLTIEPGTTVYLAANSDDRGAGMAYQDEYVTSHNDPVGSAEWDQNAILIDGRNGIIYAVGTPDQPIIFRPEGDNTSPGQWYGIFIERGTLQHARVLYGGRTAVQAVPGSEGVEVAYNEIRYAHWAGLAIFGTRAWVHHNIVEGGGHQGIGPGMDALVEHNIVTGAQTGIGVENGKGTIIRNNLIVDCTRGMELRSGENIKVLNNTIAWIAGPPKGWYYQGDFIYPAFRNGGGMDSYLLSPGITLLNNIVYGPFDWGIGLHQQPGAGSVIDYNNLWQQPTPYGGGALSAVGAHNSIQDPLFAAPATGDFSLRPGSPAIDAGDPEILDADSSPSDLGIYGGPQGTGW